MKPQGFEVNLIIAVKQSKEYKLDNGNEGISYKLTVLTPWYDMFVVIVDEKTYNSVEQGEQYYSVIRFNDAHKKWSVVAMQTE